MKVSISRYFKRTGQRVKVSLIPSDTWSLDHTLAHVIVPCLKQLRDTKHGSPDVANEDVPEHLRAPIHQDETGHTDDLFHQRWEWVLDEMIWAFEQKLIDWEDQFYSGEHDIQWKELEEKVGGESLFEMVRGPADTFKIDWDGYKAHHARMKNGFRLFGVYYEALWD